MEIFLNKQMKNNIHSTIKRKTQECKRKKQFYITKKTKSYISN